MELQKDRYFEELKAKYWNRSRSDCPLSEEEQGITLESLGGVFIATLCGLGIAMISLVLEVLCNKRKLKNSSTVPDIREVKPVESVLSPTEAWRNNKEEKNRITPPPSFEAATFRGRKIPAGITLGSGFKPRRLAINRQLGRLNSDELPTQEELPGYME